MKELISKGVTNEGGIISGEVVTSEGGIIKGDRK